MQFLFSRNYIFYKPVHSFIIAAVIMLFIPHQGALAGWWPRTCRVSPVAPLAPYVGEKCICCTAAQNLTCCHFLLGQHAWGMIQLELFRAILSKSGSAEKGAPSNSNMALECFSSLYARKARCIIGTLLWPAGCLATCGAGWRRTFSMQKGATKTPAQNTHSVGRSHHHKVGVGGVCLSFCFPEHRLSKTSPEWSKDQMGIDTEEQKHFEPGIYAPDLDLRPSKE